MLKKKTKESIESYSEVSAGLSEKNERTRAKKRII
jgi:hypothetical protein